jgi:hypothetical protein
MQGFGSGFIATGRSVEEEGRGSRHMASFKTTGGAGVLDGAAWQPLGIDSPTWLSGNGQRGQRGRWEEWWGDAWSRIRAAQTCRGSGGGRRQISRARQRAEEIGA